MEEKMPIPKYELRGCQLWGFHDMAQCIDFLFDGSQVKQGALVAMNAEKILKAEKSPALCTQLADAEYKYADGISLVRSMRRKYPGAAVSRLAGADLWEVLMQRAGRERTPVFLIGGKPNVLAETEQKLRSQWNVNLVGSQDGYLKPGQRETLFERVHASGAAIVTVAMRSPKQEMLDARLWQSASTRVVHGRRRHL